MTFKQALYLGTAATVLASIATAAPTQVRAQATAIPWEAGVWVIAETNDLSTKFAKVVVTGRTSA
jgi:hypothetical protein